MSYPCEIRTLIIEDDPDTIDTYREIFKDLLQPRFHHLAEPIFVESYIAAERELQRPHIYHIAILDLALPQMIGGSVENTFVARGLGLVPAIRDREEYPIPILMIVTADPRRIRDSPALEEQLRATFWRHWTITKQDNLADQLVPGIEAASAYSCIGIHIVGDETADVLWPMLSPREEDILRRAVLEQPSAVGIDLRWWSIERDALRAGVPAWAKVLHGKLILSGDAGRSRERLLKFVAADEGEASRKSAELLSSKLQHGQLLKFIAIGSRALLVTDKAGPTDTPVRALRTAMRDETITPSQIERIAQDVTDQLRMLGEPTESTPLLRRIIWPDHNEQRLIDGWSRLGCADDVHPASIFRELRSSPQRLIVTTRLSHGDLHAGNIAIGEDAGILRAYIIDAGFMKSDAWAKDTAVLEVSSLLHIDFGAPSSPMSDMPSLFDGTDPYGEAIDWPSVDPKFVILLRLIIYLRTQVRDECSEKTYVILLLDYLLIQIGGVSFGTTYNKITSLSNVALLFQLVVRWYRKVIPEPAAG